MQKFTLTTQKLLITSLFTFPVGLYAAENDQSNQNKNHTSITGTRVKWDNPKTALPITIISREEIMLSGFSHAADLIRNITQNSAGSFRPKSGSSLQSISMVNLRSSGSSDNLILLDGKRMPIAPSSGNVQDLNLLPLAFIERIEILGQTASAIYGDNATSGVINIISRKDIDGIEASIGQAEVSIPTHGGEREEGSVLFGTSSERGHVVAGVAWNDREIIYERDLPWTESAASVFSNNFRISNSLGNESGPFIAVQGGCEFEGSGFSLLPSGSCAYDFTRQSAEDASIENQSFYAKASHEITDNWQLWSDAHVYKTESFGRYAPVPEGSGVSLNLDPLSIDSLNNPSNPQSPHYDPNNFPVPREVHWRHRFDALGNRDDNVSNQWSRFELGARGQFDHIQTEFGIRFDKNRSISIGRNYLLRSAAGELIESGRYLLSDPYNADTQTLNSLRVTINREGHYNLNTYFANLTFEPFNLPGGQASTHLAVEYRKDTYQDQYDSLSVANQVGGSSGASAAGLRTTRSAYVETVLPVLNSLDVNLAARYENFSDLDSALAHQVSIRYQPIEKLYLRTSYANSQLQPSLKFLNQDTAAGTSVINFPSNCFAQGLPANCSVVVPNFRIGNQLLESEKVEHFGFGISYQPFDWFDFDVDYFKVKNDDTIRLTNSRELVQNGITGQFPPGTIGCHQANATGEILYCNYGYVNLGEIDTAGFDLSLRFNYQLLGVKIKTELKGSHLLEKEIDDDIDVVAAPVLGANRAVLNNSFDVGNWTFAYNINMIGDKYQEKRNPGPGTGHVPSWITHDIQINYHTPWHGKITVGARNLNANPPPIKLGNVVVASDIEYDAYLYDGYGRIVYARYSQSF